MVGLLPVSHSDDSLSVSDSKSRVVPFFQDNFNVDRALLTVNGRQAIALVMEYLQLTRADEVCILTTFDYPNVSSCVTSTIFNYCKPSRQLSPATRAVFVIHEFGVPHRDIAMVADECRHRDIPLIEDCAHTINSVHNGRQVGMSGSWIICSLPKIFPVDRGGVLLGPEVAYHPTRWEADHIVQIGQEIIPYLDGLPMLSERRRSVYSKLTEGINHVDLEPLFYVTEEITPWFFPVPVRDPDIVMDAAKLAGVECGLWHGTNIVVFPCHQYMNEKHIAEVVSVFDRAARSLP